MDCIKLYLRIWSRSLNLMKWKCYFMGYLILMLMIGGRILIILESLIGNIKLFSGFGLILPLLNNNNWLICYISQLDLQGHQFKDSRKWKATGEMSENS